MPKWRPFTWVILIVNILFLVWIIGGIASSGGTPQDCGTLSEQTCNDAEAVGTAIGVGIIFFLWALTDVILGVVWLVTRPKRRPCPVCGTDLKQGVIVCPICGHDFRVGQVRDAQVPPGIPPPPPPPPMAAT
jgi:hypothetical protein